MSEAAEKTEDFIVVGVDGSEPSLTALRWAARQARLTGSVLRVVTAWEVATSAGWVPAFPVDYDPEAVAAKALDQAITDYYLKPVIALKMSGNQLVAWNIGNEEIHRGTDCSDAAFAETKRLLEASGKKTVLVSLS